MSTQEAYTPYLKIWWSPNSKVVGRKELIFTVHCELIGDMLRPHLEDQEPGWMNESDERPKNLKDFEKEAMERNARARSKKQAEELEAALQKAKKLGGRFVDGG